MRRRALLAASVVIGAVGLLVAVGSASAQVTGSPPPASPVRISGGNLSATIITPDGGLPVNGVVESSAMPPVTGDVVVSGTVDARVTTPPDTFLAVAGDSGGTRLSVEVPDGVAITNSPTVLLGAASVAAINGRFCVPGAQNKQGVSGTVVGLPPIPGGGGTGAQLGRTSISLAYPSQGGTGFLSCYASGLVGGTSPVCTLPAAGAVTAGVQVPEGGTQEMEISDAYVLRCLLCTTAGAASANTVVVSYVEQDCNQ